MKYRNFGNTGLSVSILGLGAGHIGREDHSEESVFRLLDLAVELGVNLFDTARGYGLSEERIGRWIKSRKKEIVVSTKIGYGIENEIDWTYNCIIKGVEYARGLLNKDVIDIVHLHSCDTWILKNNGVIDALFRMKDEEKVGAIAYSGENEALDYAISTGVFDSFQFSFNLFDQQNIERIRLIKSTAGSGIIAKRPIANAPWRFDSQPYGDYCEEYWRRMKIMNLNVVKGNYSNFALRFSSYTFGVDCAIIGTSNPENLVTAVRGVEEGSLSAGEYREACERFRWNDQNWFPQI